MRIVSRCEYKILRALEGGGFGEIFLARQVGAHGFEQSVIIKAARPSNRHSQTGLIDEARLLARLNHANIVKVIEFGTYEQSSGLPVEFIALEHAGSALKQVQRGCGGKMEPGLAAYVALEVCAGLEHAHARGVVHRDIKPGNVLINAHGEVTLIDFGIAKSDDRLHHTTQLDTVKGTIHYMAPEMIQHQPLDGRADLWGVGVVLYEMLTGQLPWVATDQSATPIFKRRELSDKILTAPFPPLPESIPEALRKVVGRLLAKERDNRYATAGEVMSDLIPLAVHRWIARRELGLQATASQDPLTRNPGAGSTSDTVPVQPEKRAAPALAALSFSMSSDVDSGTFASESSAFDASSVKAPEAVDITEVIGSGEKRRGPTRLAIIAICSLAVGISGALAWRESASSARVQAAADTPAALTAHRQEPDATRETAPSTTAVPSREQGEGVLPGTALTATAELPAPPAMGKVESPEPLLASEGSSSTVGVPEPRRASLSITVVPQDAYVVLDNRKPVHGSTDFASLRIGTHVIRVGHHPEALTHEQRVRLIPGENKVRIELENPFIARPTQREDPF